jgi:hypothetical protein
MSERRRALIVANFDYTDTVLRQLSSPAQDAKELARVLRNPSIGGFEVETLINEKAAHVSEAIEEFFVFSDPKPEDLLLLYFSGHGVTDEEGQLYFATSDTQLVRQRVRRATAVGADFVNLVMRRSRSRRQVLLLDCCHSGAFAEGMRIKGHGMPGIETHFQGKGRMVLTASTGVQVSLEGSNEGGIQPSVYTQILVKGLETGEADRDGDGWVNLDELHDYLLDQIRTEAHQQTPTKSGYLEGQLYIARTAVVRPAILPRNLQNALKDPEVLMRQGAVLELGELLQTDHPGLVMAARQALEVLRDNDDSFKIRRAAANHLATHCAQGINDATEQLTLGEIVAPTHLEEPSLAVQAGLGKPALESVATQDSSERAVPREAEREEGATVILPEHVATEQQPILEESLRREGVGGNLQPRTHSHYREGVALFENGDLRGAVKELREAVRSHPTDADAHQALANVLKESGESAEALSHYNQALHLNPNSAELNFQIGLILFVKGNLKQAIAAFQKATFLQPGDATYHYNLAVCLEDKGDREAALDECRTASTIDPQDQDIQLAMERLSRDVPSRPGSLSGIKGWFGLDHTGLAIDQINKDRIARYTSHYQTLIDEELLAINAAREHLVEEAAAALAAELQKRGLQGSSTNLP